MANRIILGHDEIAHHLTWMAYRRYFKKGPQLWKNVNKIYYDVVRPEPKYEVGSDEFHARLHKCVRKDVERWVAWIRYIKKNFQQLSHMIEDNIPRYSKQVGQGNSELGQKAIVRHMLRGISPGYSKTLGKLLLPDARFMYPQDYPKEGVDSIEDMFIRNILHNEHIVKDRLKGRKKFWFVDSGYTNFIHGGNKRFHRLVRDDIHHGGMPKTFPANRLKFFDSFPRPWRRDGDTILVIEPSSTQRQLHDIDISQWREQVIKKLRKRTNMTIAFREKQGTRKTRTSLYDDLLDNPDVHCVVHYNSNAGVEAIWAGVPVITLGRHVTQPVSRHRLEDVNELYRGGLGEWLCYLSYCQFEFGELINGRAIKIMRHYHEV
jgi:hypothetical protein